MGVQILKVCQTDQLGDIGIVPDISLLFRIVITPLFCCFTKKSHVENICLRGIDKTDLLFI